jgi:3-hydroxy-9,10-secoandrosta-1,3,5(10)-triene-9,17-dione monooxygenase reductase component
MSKSDLEEARAYRRTLGAFATGVCAILTRGEGGVSGIIVNSFASVSLRPRLVLWCLDNRSERYAIFAAAKAWSVNILAGDQQDLSDRLAKPNSASLGAEAVEDWGDAPVLRHALARIGCRTHETQVLGDHLVLVGEAFRYDRASGAALGYFSGRYSLIEAPDV